MSQTWRTWAGPLASLGVLFLLSLMAGCSSPGTITGKVKYQGRPLTGGTVLFASTQGRGSQTARIGEDGSYTIEKMPPGPAKIAVETASAQPPAGIAVPPPNMQPPKGVALPPGATSGVYGTQPKARKAE